MKSSEGEVRVSDRPTQLFFLLLSEHSCHVTWWELLGVGGAATADFAVRVFTALIRGINGRAQQKQ